MGLIYATLGEHEAAVQRYIEATNHDQYLAVAYVVQSILCLWLKISYISFAGISNAESRTFCSPVMTLP